MNNTVEHPEFYPHMVLAFEEALLIENEKGRKIALKQVQNHYQELNWITVGLAAELKVLFPTRHDVDTGNNNEKNLAMFQENIHKICPPGRRFASTAQFNQAMKLLCAEWSIKVAVTNNSICCHYRESRVGRLHSDPSKRRIGQEVPTFDCPFAIRYSLPGLARSQQHKHWKPRLLHQVTVSINTLFISMYGPVLYLLNHFFSCCRFPGKSNYT